MYYLIAGIVLLVFYILAVLFIKTKVNQNKVLDVLFPVSIFLIYLFCLSRIYLDVGFSDWNFQNSLPTANVSPFMFSTVLIICILPSDIKKYARTLISLLAFGMVIAGMITMIFNYLRDYKFHLNIFLDSFVHILISLYGVYLLKTKQIYKETKKQMISGAVIVVVALIMLSLNLIFSTSFFGLSFTGSHNIYNVVVCKSAALSMVIYFIGLIVVLVSGMLYQKILKN